MLDRVKLELEEPGGASLWNLLGLHVSAWAPSGHPCFLPGPKNKHIWLIVNFELSVGVRLVVVVVAAGCLLSLPILWGLFECFI